MHPMRVGEKPDGVARYFTTVALRLRTKPLQYTSPIAQKKQGSLNVFFRSSFVLTCFLEVLVKPVDELGLVLVEAKPAMPGAFLDHQVCVDPRLLRASRQSTRIAEGERADLDPHG